MTEPLKSGSSSLSTPWSRATYVVGNPVKRSCARPFRTNAPARSNLNWRSLLGSVAFCGGDHQSARSNVSHSRRRRECFGWIMRCYETHVLFLKKKTRTSPRRSSIPSSTSLAPTASYLGSLDICSGCRCHAWFRCDHAREAMPCPMWCALMRACRSFEPSARACPAVKGRDDQSWLLLSLALQQAGARILGCQLSPPETSLWPRSTPDRRLLKLHVVREARTQSATYGWPALRLLTFPRKRADGEGICSRRQRSAGTARCHTLLPCTRSTLLS